MVILQILLVPILGAIIGYSTNLLAISMLFRPHEEKRIFGIRLPFTPGLIPKERKELSHKVGQTISENVLTKDVLSDGLGDVGEQIADNIVKMVQNFIDSAMSSPKTALELFSQVFKIEEEVLERAVRQQSKKTVDWLINHEGIKEALHGAYSDALAFSLNLAEKSLGSGKKLADIVPAEVIAHIKYAAKSNIDKLPDLLRSLLSDNRLDKRLRELVGKIAKENAGGLLGMFVNEDKIYNSIVENVLEYLEDKGNQALLLDKLEVFIDNLLEKDGKWLGTKIEGKNIEDWITKAHVYVGDKLLPALQEWAKESDISDKIADSLLSIAPGRIFTVFAINSHALDANLRKIIKLLAEKAIEHALNALDIAKLVEDKINAFETKEAERLVLSVVGKQLRWIALLGGLLGFVIGFLPALLNVLTP